MDGSNRATATLETASDDEAPPLPAPVPDRHERLAHVIEHAAHYLPAQGPITVFIHHNTLHAFEELPFDAGVQKGAALFGCQPYLSEDRYRDLLRRSRIRSADLVAELLDDLDERADELLGFMGTRFNLRLAMLQYPLKTAPAAELRWFVAETDALTRFRADAPADVRQKFLEQTRRWVMRDLRNSVAPAESGKSADQLLHLRQALASLIDHYGRSSIEEWSDATWEAFTLQTLWRVCREGVHGLKLPAPSQPAPLRHRDLLLDATGADSDELVHEVLIGFCAAFVDQGFSRWPLPDREQGFFQAFSAVYRQAGSPLEGWLRPLGAELERLAAANVQPLDSIHESLELLGVPPAEWESFVTSTYLALRGWGGMVRQVELRADSVAHAIPQSSLTEMLAVRLILDRLAVAWVAQQSLEFSGPLSEVRSAAREARSPHEMDGLDQRAFKIFQLAQVLGWLPLDLARLSKMDWGRLTAEIEAFPPLEMRRVFHAAFERQYRVQSLDAIAVQSQQPTGRVANPRFQVFCCLDEREESFRRHLEEIAPDVETFGAAGFYGVPMYYRGVGDAHFVPLCPIVIRPQHWVCEGVNDHHDHLNTRRAKARRAVGLASHQMHLGSRGFVGGAVLGVMGALASIPLVARVMFPRLTARLTQMFGSFVEPPSQTRLQLERSEEKPGIEPGNVGYSLDEMANMSERLLRDLGLTSGFARLVIVIGHGSYSVNNPHISAYNCGACGGSCGGPNARALAEILNDPRVREKLKSRGLVIPDETVFIGSWHNTCNDGMTYFDLERIPPAHREEFDRARLELEEACDRNAHERCRRFVSAPLNMSFAAARRHVENRA
ncbi:MAG TPA: putative inorganic carbon transporter subunit DabA, partial [Pirellulaceae bacterium]|nr:putative inorganic carbon transporter subunit DabA [Pirellulaceae bacterium]